MNRLLRERILIFAEVKAWRRPQSASERREAFRLKSLQPPEYCNKCGLCCEVASGIADFPFPSGLPERWKEIFAQGLGRGHRFCPFLWENNGEGGSLCSIYPWRSNPCRLFDIEECDFFWKSPEPEEISDDRKLLLIGRCLSHLINTGKLPLSSANVAAKGPKLLKFNRV
ncbi:MAG: YkgJ family cysteine cluster protein [Desulfobacteraceae bacterium]|nr:YkgJ family cysteine cluster protein [Desulfobacteraceae bacterium]